MAQQSYFCSLESLSSCSSQLFLWLPQSQKITCCKHCWFVLIYEILVLFQWHGITFGLSQQLLACYVNLQGNTKPFRGKMSFDPQLPCVNFSALIHLNMSCWSSILTSLWQFLLWLYKRNSWGAWVAQLVERPTSAQVMISQFVSSSPESGSVLTAQNLEPASDSVSPPLSTPAPFVLSLSLSLSLSQK